MKSENNKQNLPSYLSWALLGIAVLLTLYSAWVSFNGMPFQVGFLWTIRPIHSDQIEAKGGELYVFDLGNGRLSAHQKPSLARLLEDGKPLPKGNNNRNEIRNKGEGRYVFWYTGLYFSSSDHTNPIENGRSYTIRYPLIMGEEILYGITGIFWGILLLLGIIAGGFRASPGVEEHPGSWGDKKAIFLDRDGVLVQDVDLLAKKEDIRVFPDAADSLQALKGAGYLLFVISNQTVIARGLINEIRVEEIQKEIEARLKKAGAPALDGFYYCPHHPNATLIEYRQDCDCRKPKPGLILRAAEEHGIDLPASYMIGDRISDIIAGHKAGCRTILLETGAHTAPPIQTIETMDLTIQPDHTCAGLAAAARFILEDE